MAQQSRAEQHQPDTHLAPPLQAHPDARRLLASLVQCDNQQPALYAATFRQRRSGSDVRDVHAVILRIVATFQRRPHPFSVCVLVSSRVRDVPMMFLKNLATFLRRLERRRVPRLLPSRRRTVLRPPLWIRAAAPWIPSQVLSPVVCTLCRMASRG